MEASEYYVQWREDFEDQKGWFTKSELIKEIDRFYTIEDGEFDLKEVSIIKGHETSIRGFLNTNGDF